MSMPQSCRAVYKTIGTQEIDADVYLPTPGPSDGAQRHPVVINIHGGAFMLGSSKMVNMDQVADCLERGWIVLVPNHRLCPKVNLLEGPMQDCRDLLGWVYSGGLQEWIGSHATSRYPVDLDHIFAFGTSSGGTLALALGFGVPRPVAGIFDMYGPCNFSDAFWTTSNPEMLSKFPRGLTEDFINQVFAEEPVPTTARASLEGQQPGPPDFSDPRQAYALTQLANGTLLRAILPSSAWEQVDPALNIRAAFPPTFIVHGEEDTSVPIHLSRHLYSALSEKGVKCAMREVPGEGHTFAAKMKVGSQTWHLQREGFDFLQRLV